MRYKIIYDYGLEGWSFEDEEWETVEEAVKKAISNNKGVPFLIVKIVDWEAWVEIREVKSKIVL